MVSLCAEFLHAFLLSADFFNYFFSMDPDQLLATNGNQKHFF